MAQIFCGERGVRAEKQTSFAIDHARIEVWDRHGRGANLGLAIHLGVMTLGQGRVVAAQPLAADGNPP